MGATPQELRNDVEYRRAHLADSVDRLAERMAPRRVARRKMGAARGRLSGLTHRVMGSVQDGAQSIADTTGQAAGGLAQTAKDAAGTVADTAETVGSAVQEAPARLERRTQGSPLGAGLVAFGAGMLAAALIPATEAEERLGRQVREHSDELVEPVGQAAAQAAREVKEGMQEPAAEAVEAVKGAAQDAAGTARDEALAAGQETAEGLRDVGRGTAEELRNRNPGTGAAG
ncbi:hypothetical protein SUDANB120_05915 [Streptomyces sp. enrichment culture]|uniref:DUF3618 domain-containing protein n=1 Tax=Streptomyces sp. enrichment culture TaxID=1795815 RepID=UPI003F56AFD3